MTPREAARRLWALVAYRRLESDLDDEVAAHLDLLEHDARARGLTPEAARLDARRRFGADLRIREAHRSNRGVSWLETTLSDTRHAGAALVRARGFTAAVVGVLALGIGPTTAVFSLVDAVLLRPLPFDEPDRIVRVWETPSPGSTSPTTTGVFLALKAESRAFAALSAESFSTATVDLDGRPVRWTGRYVSADHFDVYRVRPLVGRAFRADEDRDGGPRVVILSHAAWQTHFGGSPTVIGRTLRLDGLGHEVIGVLPRGPFDRETMHGTDAPASFWRLNQFSEDEAGAPAQWLSPVGRLASGFSQAQALADTQGVRASIASDVAAWKRSWSVALEPVAQRLVGDRLRVALLASFGAVAMVLLLACGSVANLLLARHASRQREFAVRAALGASRGRLTAQVLSESLILAILGTGCGLFVADACLQAAVGLLPPLPFTSDIALDTRVLAVAAGLSFAVVMTVGLLPAVNVGASARALHAARGATGDHRRLRQVFVAGQVAVSVALVYGSLLLGESLRRLQDVDTGTRKADVLTVSVELPRDRYPNGARLGAFYTDAVDRLRTIAGVTSVSISADLPLEGAGHERLSVPGASLDIQVRFKRVDPGYFQTFGIPLLAGRGFTLDDRLGAAPVVIISDALAAHVGGRAAEVVDRSVELPLPGWAGRRARMRVVGVVGTERVAGDLRAAVEPVAYVALAQNPRLQVKLAIHAADARSVLTAATQTIHRLDPGLALADARTIDDIWNTSLSSVRGPAMTVTGFAMASLLVATLGLFGLLAHTVLQRHREIGIRLALGAGRAAVAITIVRDIAVLVFAGVAIGFATAAASAPALAPILYDTSPVDPRAFCAAGLAVVVVALLAAIVPLRRALRIAPAETLRAEG